MTSDPVITKSTNVNTSSQPQNDAFVPSETITSPLYGGVDFNLESKDGYFDGYNLFNLHAIDAEERGTRINNSLVIYDMEGNLILENWRINKPVEMINSTTVLGESAIGAVLWNMETNKYQFLRFFGHHDYEFNPNDNTIFTIELTTENISGTYYRFDEIKEYDLEGHLVWTLDMHDFINYTQWCLYEDHARGLADVTHTNTVFYDVDNDMLYINVRNVNTFYKIDHSTGEVVWALGEYGDFALYDHSGQERGNLFYHSHALEKIDDNRFIMFDNDVHNQTDFYSRNSRVIEIEIDEDTMTAREVWTWTGNLSYYSEWWGDADRLPNGNRLAVFGSEVKDDGPYGARLVEINDAGEIVWEMSFINNDEFIYGVYQMERIRFSPILSSVDDILIAYDSECSLSWQAWYNFRPKRTIVGAYTLYVDDAISESGSLDYDPYWRPSDLQFTIDGLDVGDHNVTLAIQDEAGHTTSDTVNVSVRAFHIDRTGYTITEHGVSSSIVWSGVSSYIANYDLSVDGATIAEDVWDGSDIMLNLQSYSVGTHEVELVFTNSSGVIYTDSFDVTINPSGPPIFNSIPNNTQVDWNTSSTLRWSVFDYSPTNWTLCINGTPTMTGYWSDRNHNISWSFRDLDEGMYNVTMALVDVVSNSVSSLTWLYVIPPSPPVMTHYPSSRSVKWAKSTVHCKWEVHGGNRWTIYRNGSLINEGIKKTPQIILEIKHWQADGWRLGTYNITLKVNDGENSIFNTIWLNVFVDFGDAYVDSVVSSRSVWYTNGDAVIGAPDFNSALIYQDYGPGYMTLDMGAGEEILDRAGDDFQVIISYGSYLLSVASDINQQFVNLGAMIGEQSVDLSTTGLTSVRYIRIEILSSDSLYLDAIVAKNYNKQGADTAAPDITPLNPISIWTNQTPYTIDWEVSDRTPWNYSVYVNDTLAFEGPWDGSEITYLFDLNTPGIWDVKLVVYDLFDNTANSSIIITLKLVQSWEFIYPLAIITSISAASLIMIYQYRRIRVTKSEE
jgi:hypothetical protein